MTEAVTVPYGFSPREYQLEMFKALDGGKRRALLVWSRRAGKDLACLNYMIKEMFNRVGQYYYFFPTYEQGRKALWEGIDNDGKKFLDYFPPGSIVSMSKQQMTIELVNGSLFRIVAADRVEKGIVGTNPVGMVFSEYSLQDPMGWQLMSPVASQNNAWVIFNGTPRGRNHMYDLENNVKDSKTWFFSKKTIEELNVYTQEEIDHKISEDKMAGMDDDAVAQEYYCSYAAGMKGAYYADQIEQARQEGRVGSFDPCDHKWTDTFWDIGIDDSTVVWFRQTEGNRIYWVDYYEASGQPLSHYVRMLQERGYNYRTHYLPHDGAARSFQTGHTTKDMFFDLLQQASINSDITIAPRLPIQDGINAVRSRFSRFYFNEGLTYEGIRALEAYHRKWDFKKQAFLVHPVHNWASHAADAIRTEALAEEMDDSHHLPQFGQDVISDFDPFDY